MWLSLGQEAPMPMVNATAASQPLPAHRSLVAVASSAPRLLAGGCTTLPRAAFLAHLIATERRVPQLRERRRGDPREAAAAYRAICARPSAASRAPARSA
jgi:hypothetical protein